MKIIMTEIRMIDIRIRLNTLKKILVKKSKGISQRHIENRRHHQA
jgi:hypothetical protein